MYELFTCQMSRTDDICDLASGPRIKIWTLECILASALAVAAAFRRVLPLVMVFEVSCCAIYFMDRITIGMRTQKPGSPVGSDKLGTRVMVHWISMVTQKRWCLYRPFSGTAFGAARGWRADRRRCHKLTIAQPS